MAPFREKNAISQIELRNQYIEVVTLTPCGIMDYISCNEGKMYRKGFIASQMADGMPLVRAELLDSICDHSMDINIIVSWLSLFVEGANFQETNLNIQIDLKLLIEESINLADTDYHVHLNKNVCFLVADIFLSGRVMIGHARKNICVAKARAHE